MKLKIKYNRLTSGLYLLLLLALPLFSFGNDKVDALFAKGNQLYAKEQYQAAVQTYQQILNDGYQSAVVYFNTGNAYYKLGDMPSAILYYEKAHKLAPGDDDINTNIKFANLKITDKVEARPEFFVSAWWHSFILLFPAATLSWLSILFFIAGFLLLIWYLFTNSLNVKKASFYAGITGIAIGVVIIFIANRQVSYFNSHHQAIVFSGAVIVKGSPDVNAKPLFMIHEGTKVEVIQKNDNWIEVQLPNGNAGWMAVDNVKDI